MIAPLVLLAVAVASPANAGEVIPLWPNGAPGSEGKTGAETPIDRGDGLRRIAGIHNPSLVVRLPPKRKATGAAVIILPGGGHRYLAIDNEGYQVADWLAARGVAGFVLKYRLAREEGSTYKVEEHALADALRAVRLVRSRAKGWGLDPARVGILGFSAGGQLAALAGMRFDAGKPDAVDPIDRESARPAFQGLLYPGAPPEGAAVPKDAPPAFLCTAADDQNPTRNVLAQFSKLREAGVAAELHVFARGGHGFGMKTKDKDEPRPVPVTAWSTRFLEWLGDQGFLQAGAKRADRGDELDHRFAAQVQPILAAHCLGCHGEKPKGDLDLRPFTSAATVAAAWPRWAEVMEKVAAGDMPPKAKPPLPAAARKELLGWLEAVRAHEAGKRAGDPGPVLARRLSNAEYNYSIRDLTGVDIRPTREFPVDPSNQAGFDNSGESLAMSPALLKKYLEAAREVANHLVLAPDRLAFAPHPMLVETDRDKYSVGRIVDFYKQQNTDLAAYFLAAWRFKHRAALGQPRATLESLAAAGGLSPRYLATIWSTLEEARETVGPLARLQASWRKLPRSAAAAEKAAGEMRDFVLGLRGKLAPRFRNPTANDIRTDAQPFTMWKNRQYAAHRMRCDRSALQIDGKVAPPGAVIASKGDDDDEEEAAPAAPAAVDPDLAIPAADRARHEAAFDRFCAVFPDTFYVAERGRNYGRGPTSRAERGRLLSAGFHNVMGYFRDDQPLYQLLLDDRQKATLDGLWRELDVVADATHRTYLQFAKNGAGTEIAAKGKDPAIKDVISSAAIERLRDNYLARASGSPVAQTAIREHFTWVNTTLRAIEAARAAAEPKHLEGLLALAARAYRRPLSEGERAGIRAHYQEVRKRAGADPLAHEEAMRDALVGVLMSPDFLFRLDLDAGPVAGGVHPLSDHALASRLSYFLWSSLPDEALLARARAGALARPEVLVAEARRLLADPRARALATEFGGNWLDFRRFEGHNTVDRERYPAFDDALRSAMFEEPVRFLQDLFQRGSVLDLLHGRHTFVNAPLAKLYGMPASAAPGADGWWRVPDASRYGRGGVLPMAVFLTKNAPGLRTSPVKRGYWVARNVLGERIPPPPAVVPELPRDEAKLELPLREALAQHREDPACAGCHARFDSLGLVFEGYGLVGEARSKDLAGRAIDASASFPGGGSGRGLPGLRQYLRTRRQDDFLDNLARKLLAYGLGRSLQLSDDATVAAMKRQLARDGYRFASLVESVVVSPQFRNRRAAEPVAVSTKGAL